MRGSISPLTHKTTNLHSMSTNNKNKNHAAGHSQEDSSNGVPKEHGEVQPLVNDAEGALGKVNEGKHDEALSDKEVKAAAESAPQLNEKALVAPGKVVSQAPKLVGNVKPGKPRIVSGDVWINGTHLEKGDTVTNYSLVPELEKLGLLES